MKRKAKEWETFKDERGLVPRYIHDDQYPVCWLGPDGRRHVGLASSNRGAKDHEHVTGWGYHPEDLPNHKVAKR